jgi:hypothetical protein
MKIIDRIKAYLKGDGLPGWASIDGDGKINVDPDKAYPHYLEKLGADQPDQYWLEVARRSFTEDLQQIVGGPIHVVIDAKGGQWALRNYPEGAGADAGANGFRKHYNEMKKG